MPVNETIERIVYEGVDKITAVSKSAADSQKALAGAIDGVKSGLAAVGVTVGAGAMVVLAMDTLKATAALDDMAESTGASVEGLSAIQRVAKVSGADFDGLTGQIGRMVKGLREGKEEGSRAEQAFAFLGVRARETDGRFRDTSEILVEFAQKLETVTDRGNRAVLVQDALGKGAERYIPLLKDIAEGTDLVATTTTKQAQQAEVAEKNIRRLTLAYEDSRRELVNEYTPALIRFTEQLLAAQKVAGGFWAFLSISGKQADDPLTALGEIEARLAKLRADREVLAGDSLGAKFNRMMAPEDLTVLGMQIRTAERQQAVLQEMLQRRVSGNAKGLAEDAAGNVGPASATPGRVYNPPDEGAMAKAQKEREFVARQLQEGLEEEQRIQGEAFHWTAFYADKKRDAEKAAIDARIQAQIDYYDRDQELAIQRGEQTVAADGLAHSLKLEMFRQGLLTEEELEIEAHTLRLERIAEFSAAELAELGGHQAVKEQIEQEHQSRLLQIRSRGLSTLAAFSKASWQQQSATIFGELASITAGVAQHNKTLFEINKVAGIAVAISNAYIGISRTLATYPFPWNIAMAAAHGLVAFATVQQIRSSSFGDGGGAPSLASTPAPPVTPVDSPFSAPPSSGPPQITVTLAGAGRYTAEEVRDLIVVINEQLRDGMKLQS